MKCVEKVVMKLSHAYNLAILFLALSFIAAAGASAAEKQKTFFDLSAKDIDGKTVEFSKFKGQVLLIVNTASKCGFTKQYDGLQEIYSKYKDQGFSVLGFPSNDFMSQEPGTNEEIKYFCTQTYKVAFPMFAKTTVKGDKISDVYQFLTSAGPSETRGNIAWNFNKFLINREGNIVRRFTSSDKPTSGKVTRAIQFELDVAVKNDDSSASPQKSVQKPTSKKDKK